MSTGFGEGTVPWVARGCQRGATPPAMNWGSIINQRIYRLGRTDVEPSCSKCHCHISFQRSEVTNHRKRKTIEMRRYQNITPKMSDCFFTGVVSRLKAAFGCS